jgi:hypothetical protein
MPGIANNKGAIIQEAGAILQAPGLFLHYNDQREWIDTGNFRDALAHNPNARR